MDRKDPVQVKEALLAQVADPQGERQVKKLEVDRDTDAHYLRLDDPTIMESQEVSPGVVLDFNDQRPGGGR